MDNIKTKLGACVENSSTLKEGYFIHADKEINDHWIDLSGLHRQFLLNKKVVKKALRKKLIEENKKNTIDTIIFTTQCFSENSDFRLSCIEFIVDDVLQELNRKKDIDYTYIRKKATDGKLMLSPKPKNMGNVLLITALSSHESLIEKALNIVKDDSTNNGKSVLSIIGIFTRISDTRIDGMADDPSHSCLIKLISDIRPDTSKNHTVESSVVYNISDYLKDLKNFFIHDMRGISVIVLSLSLILVLVYYNPPIINGFFELLKQNKNILIIYITLIASIIAIAGGILKLVKYISKKKSANEETKET